MFRKFIVVLFLIIWTLTSLVGCALFQSEAQYDKGIYFSLADHKQVARMKQDKLALEKLKAKPVLQGEESSGVEACVGYLGKVMNFSSYRKNFIIRGPETKSFLVEPGRQKSDCLSPGEYHAELWYGQHLESRWTFHVTGEIHHFGDEPLHWYLIAER